MKSFIVPESNLSQLQMKYFEDLDFSIEVFINENQSNTLYNFRVKHADIISDPYDSIWLKLLTVFVYIVELITSIIMVAFVSYEAQGLAGHYRTLINQLLSCLYGMVILLSYLQEANDS